eukprot:Gb_03766 [translate_table: standard]
MTGLKLHTMGWHSIYCKSERPALMGSAPGNGPDILVQQKRWATGLLEIFVNKLSPLLGIKRSISCLALPAYSLISGKSFLPKISEPAFGIAAAPFVSVYGFKLLEYVNNDCSIRECNYSCGHEMWKRLLAEYICSVFAVIKLWPFLTVVIP